MMQLNIYIQLSMCIIPDSVYTLVCRLPSSGWAETKSNWNLSSTRSERAGHEMLHPNSKALAYHFSICSPGKLCSKDKVCLILLIIQHKSISHLLSMLKQASPLVYILNRHRQQDERTRDETRVLANGKVSLLATSTDGKGENEKLSSGNWRISRAFSTVSIHQMLPWSS